MSVTAKSTLQRNRVSSRREDDELPSSPVVKRGSLSVSQQQGTRKHQVIPHTYQHPHDADALDEEELPITDNLVENDAPVTQPPQRTVVPLRTRSSAQLELEPKGIGWTKIVVILLISALALWGLIWGILSLISWGTDVSDTYTYGPLRTSAVSGVFGMNNDSLANPTWIVAINLKGTLVIESLPGGDVSKMKSYPTGFAMIGDAAAKLPVRLTIEDLNGDHKPDVQIKIPGQSITLKLINNGSGFTLTK